MIREYHHKHTNIRLVDNNTLQSGSNIFSILVGKNGTGKSTFLGNLTNEFIKETRHRRKNNLFEQHQDDIVFPSQIISVSTSPFDKFPIDRLEKESNYTYLGLRDLHSSNFGLAYLSKIIASLIESVSKESRQAYEIGRVLDYLGYRDEILIGFQLFQSRRFLEEILETNQPAEILFNQSNVISRRVTRSFFLNKDESYSERKIYKLKEIAEKILREDLYRPNFELVLNRNGININYEESEDILFLIQAGILKLKDVKLQSNKDYSFFSIKDASSGEQSIILSILGIASKIKDNSLICIDEPEICLHPQWQEKYIEILINTFEQFRNCHFIIATHSPQIISKLTNVNSFIVDMETGSTKNATEFINHSADYQLANIFDSPGFKNEYLSRIALNIFTKVSNRKSFDNDDLNKLQLIEKQSKYLEHSDPVYDLYITLKKLYDIYG